MGYRYLDYCPKCSGPIMRGRYGGLFCSMCGWQKKAKPEMLAHRKQQDKEKLARQFPKKAWNNNQQKISREGTPNSDGYNLSSQETERLQKIYDKNSKITGGPPPYEPVIWVNGKMSAVEPRVYRGSFQDRD